MPTSEIHTTTSVNAWEIRRLAVEAHVCENSVRRYLAGSPVRNSTAERLTRACAQLGVPNVGR